jgi:hypothetical protein
MSIDAEIETAAGTMRLEGWRWSADEAALEEVVGYANALTALARLDYGPGSGPKAQYVMRFLKGKIPGEFKARPAATPGPGVIH